MADTSKTEISILDGCSASQLRELLALASKDPKTARDWLLEIGDSERMEHLLTEMCRDAGQSGTDLLRAVCSPDTLVEDLAGIKALAKRLTAAAKDAEHKAAATLLYHLAVAAALGHHRRNISSKTPVARRALYKDLAAELADDDLVAIFEKATATDPE